MLNALPHWIENDGRKLGRSCRFPDSKVVGLGGDDTFTVQIKRFSRVIARKGMPGGTRSWYSRIIEYRTLERNTTSKLRQNEIYYAMV